MVVREFYAGKTVLLTGTTGFIGKVMLEKFLRDLPDVRTIYLLIRSNNESPAKERFEDEIVASRVFDRLRDKMQNEFLPFINAKVVPIAGDLSQHNIGLSSADMDTLINNVNVVIHCAASIDFKERLDKAIESNVLGTMRLFNIAKKFRSLNSFVHCSTAYVNCNKSGEIEERIPQLNFDPEEMVRFIMKHKVSEIDRLTDTLLARYNYPNTYTFTKAIAENVLVLKREGIPLIFVRPTIVGSSLREPVPGWVDSVAAVAAAILYVGVGVVRFMRIDGSLKTDVVPCDFVSNALIAAGPAIAGRNTVEIIHVGTTSTNPESWNNVGFHVEGYWRHHTPKKSIGTPSFHVHESHLIFESRFWWSYTAPASLYSLYASIFGNSGQRKNAQRFGKMVKAARLINDTFSFFTKNEWIFSTQNLNHMYDTYLSEEDKRMFFIDGNEIKWKSYYEYFCYGLAKYVLQESGVKPPSNLLTSDLITKHDINSRRTYLHWIFADISWALASYQQPTQVPRQPSPFPVLKRDVLGSEKIKSLVAKIAKDEKLSIEKVEARANSMYDKLSGNMNISCVRFMAWFLKKVWRRIYQTVNIDEKGLQAVREAITRSPVVLIPSHRSYLDFLLMSFIFFAYELPMPMIAAGEDFLSVLMVRSIFKSCGAFFLRRGFDGDALYWAIFSEYVEQLVINHRPVEFFIEGKRSRTGKSLHPKTGMLNMVVAPYLEGKINDLNIVPISISFDKALEGELYTQEMLGESKAKESLNGLLRASKVLRMNWGRINIVFSQPISVKQYTDNFIQRKLSPPIADTTRPLDPFNQAEDKKELVHSLAFHIIKILQKNIVIAPTSILATILLTYRRGLSREELIAKCDWLREEIEARGVQVAFEGTAEAMVDFAIPLLRNLIVKNRNMYEIGSATSSSSLPNANYRKNVLVLSYYRNQLLWIFQWEGTIAVVMASLCGLKSKKKSHKTERVTTVDEPVLLEEVSFLTKLWVNEFPNSPNDDVNEITLQTLDKFVGMGILTRHTTPKSDKAPSQRLYAITPKGEGMITFLSHLFWPFVESYFISCLTLFTVSPIDAVDPNLLSQRMGWLGEKMYDEGKLSFYESCNTQILANSINVFVSSGVLIKKAEDADLLGKKRKSKKAAEEVKKNDSAYVLSPRFVGKNGPLGELTKHIGKYRKTPPTSTKTSDLQSSLLEDFPIIAKL